MTIAFTMTFPWASRKKLHDYEHFYDDCFVKRQFSPELSACPKPDCEDATAMTKAISTLQAGCLTAQACADPTCADAIKAVLAAHDLCPEDKLPNNLEVALHDHEEPCEAQLCNSAEAAFDPYSQSCGADVTPTASAASGFAFLVTMLALSFAVLISP